MSSTVEQLNRKPVPICIGGLPVTGETTVARTLAAGLRAAYVRIDSIETAIGRAEGRFRQTNGRDLPGLSCRRHPRSSASMNPHG